MYEPNEFCKFKNQESRTAKKTTIDLHSPHSTENYFLNQPPSISRYNNIIKQQGPMQPQFQEKQPQSIDKIFGLNKNVQPEKFIEEQLLIEKQIEKEQQSDEDFSTIFNKIQNDLKKKETNSFIISKANIIVSNLEQVESTKKNSCYQELNKIFNTYTKKKKLI